MYIRDKQSKNMLKPTAIFAISVLLSVAQHHCTDATIKSFKVSHNYPQKQVIHKSDSFKEGNVVYAVCHGSSKTKNCTVTQERYPDGKTQRSCDISLDVYQENSKLSDEVHVVAFGHDNAILFWDEIGPTTVFKVLTVNFDDCQTGGFVLPDPSMRIYDQQIYNNKIVTYDDKFEMFIKNSNLSNDVDGIESVITVNSRGIVDKKATDFMRIGKSEIRSISSLDANTSNRSYVYSKDLDDKYGLMIHKSDGSDKMLATYHDNVLRYTSTVNELITLCVGTGTICTQFDKEGNIKFNITLDGSVSKEEIAMRDLYNLPGGGFLVLLSEYDKSDDEVDFTKVIDYSVVKINGKGKKVGSIHLNELADADNTASYSVAPYVWKNGNEEYCAAVISQGINQTLNPDDIPSDLCVVVKCFNDADLSD